MLAGELEELASPFEDGEVVGKHKYLLSSSYDQAMPLYTSGPILKEDVALLLKIKIPSNDVKSDRYIF